MIQFLPTQTKYLCLGLEQYAIDTGSMSKDEKPSPLHDTTSIFNNHSTNSISQNTCIRILDFSMMKLQYEMAEEGQDDKQ